MEMEKVVSELGLESKPGEGMAAQGSKVPAGFVPSSGQTPTDTMRTLEKETVTRRWPSWWTSTTAPSPLKVGSPYCRLCLRPQPDLPEPSHTGNSTPFWLLLSHRPGRHLWSQRFWKSTASPRGRPPTMRCWRSATPPNVADPWCSWTRRTRGRPQNWFAQTAMHPGDLCRNAFFARVLPQLIWVHPPSRSLRWMARPGN